MIALEFNRTLRSLPSYLDVKPPIFFSKKSNQLLPRLSIKSTNESSTRLLYIGHQINLGSFEPSIST